MNAVIGLGNPDSRYALTRHNIGFQVAEKIAANLGISFQKDKGYVFAKGVLQSEAVLLVKPMTFMNRSGIAVQKIMRYHGLPLDKLLVILDDLDLPFGAFRFRARGSDGGNKGLRSIISHTGTEEIHRLRIGIRNRDTIANPSRYVLSNFNRKERGCLPDLLETAEEAVKCWITDGIDAAMNRFNRNHLIH